MKIKYYVERTLTINLKTKNNPRVMELAEKWSILNGRGGYKKDVLLNIIRNFIPYDISERMEEILVKRIFSRLNITQHEDLCWINVYQLPEDIMRLTADFLSEQN